MTPRAARGFSLLEVLVALAILGLGLTAILSAQTGLFATSTKGANMAIAANLGRCRMSELEVKLLKNGYPIGDDKGEGRCCVDDPDSLFECTWVVGVVVLPNMNNNADGGLSPSSSASLDGGLPPMGSGPTVAGLGSAGPMGSAGPPGFTSGLSPTDTSGLGSGLGALGMLGGGMGALGGGMSPMGGGKMGQLGGVSGGSMAGIASMAMSMVYPALKPMMEASIRRLTVTVKWKEGRSARDLELVQYVTNPQQGGMMADVPGGVPLLQQMMGTPGLTPGSTPGSTGTQSGTSK